MKTLSGTLRFLSMNKEAITDDNYAWCNVGYRFTEYDIKRLMDYFKRRRWKIEYIAIAVGVEKLRPQRTWGALPDWVAPADGHYPVHADENTFLFINCKEGGGQLLRNIEDFVKPIPGHEFHVIR